MTTNKHLQDSIRIFKELGWDTARPEDALTLPLGTKKQQADALRGLRSGSLSEQNSTEGFFPHRYESQVDVHEPTLVAFAIRLGVDAARTLALIHDHQIDDVKEEGPRRWEHFLPVIESRGSEFISQVVNHRRRGPFGSHIAAALVLRNRLEPPYFADYLDGWAYLAENLLPGGEFAEGELVTVELLRHRFIAHASYFAQLGHRNIGDLLTRAVAAGLLSQQQAVTVCLERLSFNSAPARRKDAAKLIIDGGEETLALLPGHLNALIPVFTQGDGPLIEHLAVPLIRVVDPEQLYDLIQAALYVRSQKGIKLVLQAIAERTDIPSSTREFFAPQLQEHATGNKKQIANVARKILDQWKVAAPVALPAPVLAVDPGAANYWQATPPLWEMTAWEKPEPTVQSLARLVHEIKQRYSWITTSALEDRLLPLAVGLSRIAPEQVRQHLGQLDRDTAAFVGKPAALAKDRSLSLRDRRDREILARYDVVPCVLSEPSFADLSVDPDVLIDRLYGYELLDLPVSCSDLLLAIDRIPVEAYDKQEEIRWSLEASPVGILNTKGKLHKENVGQVFHKLFAIIDEGSAHPVRDMAAAFPALVANQDFDFPGIQVDYMAWNGGYIESIRYDAMTAANKKTPLDSVEAANLIGIQRPIKPELNEYFGKAIRLAWGRGLLQPGVASVTDMDQRNFAGPTKGLALLATATRELAEDGMLSVVWPLWDDIVGLSAHLSRMPAGVADIAAAMMDFAPYVPAEHAQAPGLRDMANSKKSNAAVLTAREAVFRLPTPPRQAADCGGKPEQSPREQKSSKHHEFEMLWDTRPEPGPAASDNSEIFLEYHDGLGGKKVAEVKVWIPGYDRVFEAFSFDMDTVTFSGMYLDDDCSDAFLHFNGKRIQILLRSGERHPITNQPVDKAPQGKLSAGVLATVIAKATDTYEPEWDRQHLTDVLLTLRPSTETCKLAVRKLLPNPDFEPARAAYVLQYNVALLPHLWPLLTESVADAVAYDHNPRWLPKILSIMIQYQDELAYPLRHGLIHPEDFEPVRQLAAKSSKSAAVTKAKALVKALELG